MMNAKTFVLRANSSTKFNICIDDECFDELDKDEAVTLVDQYERKYQRTHKGYQAEVTYWFISTAYENTICMNVL